MVRKLEVCLCELCIRNGARARLETLSQGSEGLWHFFMAFFLVPP